MRTLGATRRFVALLAALALPVFCGALWNLGLPLAVGLNLAALALWAVDLIALGRVRAQVSRQVPAQLEAGRETPVVLSVENPGRHGLRGRVGDTPPAFLAERQSDLPVRVGPGRRASVSYPVRPARRGDAAFGDVYLQLTGPLGLATRTRRYPAAQLVPVLPDLTPLARYRLRTQARQKEAGNRRYHRTGVGTDFDSIRPYVPGDAYRSVNWRATARTGSVMVNQFDVEINQQVMLVVDAGRAMAALHGGVSRLDWSLQAALLLAQAAVSGGDKVGCAVLGRQVTAYQPPRGRAAALTAIVRQLHGVAPIGQESDFTQLTASLGRRLGKRSLICIFTQLSDADQARELAAALSPLMRKHAILVVAPLDPAVDALLTRTPQGVQDVYQKAAAQVESTDLRQVAALTERLGLGLVLVPPDQLPGAAVNAYLKAKQRGVV
ncbi:MAG: DUF58 domain-containing protein [Christensenellales bacterium]|jgi:uncharacterized protein (DUF58 family)